MDFPAPSSPLWPPRRHRLRVWQFLGLFALVFLISLLIGFNPALLITELPYLLAFIGDITPPNFNFVFQKPQVIYSLLSTVAMAFLGSFVGGGIALLLSFLAARNLSPNRYLSMLVYGLFTLERIIPSFVILLFFLLIAGIGPFSGTLALIIATIGTFGKLFAESLEQVEENVLESIRTTGAGRLQWIRYGAIPEAAPSIIGYFFYSFDVNIRRAIGLGIFGGGGLGFDLYLAMGMMEYRSALALMFVMVVLVFLSEQVSNYLRKRVMS